MTPTPHIHMWSPHPGNVLIVTFVMLCGCAYLGAYLHRRFSHLWTQGHEDLGTVLTATLTLLGLIIGFTFSMSTSRYDLRKSYEEGEANAIGTEYLRVEVLGAEQAAQLKAMLRSYTALRLRFFSDSERGQREALATETLQLQARMWNATRAAVTAAPTPVTALALAGMNDVLNSQSYTQAAWWNRIPGEAWALMALIAVFCNLMLGYITHRPRPLQLGILPLVVAIAFFLIADIDSPRSGVIHVAPQNLLALFASLQ